MRWTLTLMMMTLALPQAVHAQAPEAPPRVPPAPGCLDARQMAEVRQASSTELAVQGRDGQRFRITLSEGCPGAGRADAVLLAREGWVCGTGQEYVRIGEATCAVTGIAAIDAREYAAMARAASMQTDDGVTTLETVEVRAPQRRGFAGSSSFCFNPRYMRAWSEDNEGMLVELSPRRSGGIATTAWSWRTGAPIWIPRPPSPSAPASASASSAAIPATGWSRRTAVATVSSIRAMRMRSSPATSGAGRAAGSACSARCRRSTRTSRRRAMRRRPPESADQGVDVSAALFLNSRRSQSSIRRFS